MKHRYFDHYRNELTQCYLRIAFALFCFAAIFIYEKIYSVDLSAAVSFLGLFFAWILVYFLLIRKFPRLLARERILIAMIVDILATAWCMHLSHDLAALVASTFIWYILGYGMRFGFKYALTATVMAVAVFLTLAVSTPYWRSNPLVVFGWILAYIAIPLYSFALVKRLHISLRELNSALTRTERLAHFDSLTDLYNRHYFTHLAEEMMQEYGEVAILLIDLDGFKEVNDSCGHAVGDQLLISVAASIKACCCDNCLVGRLGGDEFMVAVGGRPKAEIMKLGDDLVRSIEEVGHDFCGLSASAGISFYPDDADELSQVKRNADIAMYQAKRQGKRQALAYSAELPGMLKKEF